MRMCYLWVKKTLGVKYAMSYLDSLKFHSDKLGSCNRLFRKRLKTEGGRLIPDRLQVPKKLLKKLC